MISEEDKARIVEYSTNNRFHSAKDIKNNLHLAASRETINWELNRMGFKAYKAPSNQEKHATKTQICKRP